MSNRYVWVYCRWWEARKMWGQMLNITRNLVRQVLEIHITPMAPVLHFYWQS